MYWCERTDTRKTPTEETIAAATALKKAVVPLSRFIGLGQHNYGLLEPYSKIAPDHRGPAGVFCYTQE